MTSNVATELINLIHKSHRLDGDATSVTVRKILEKYNVTEKPGPAAPFGTIRVTASSDGRAVNVFISNGDGTWVTIFHDKGHGEGRLDWSAPWPVLPPGEEEVFRP